MIGGRFWSYNLSEVIRRKYYPKHSQGRSCKAMFMPVGTKWSSRSQLTSCGEEIQPEERNWCGCLAAQTSLAEEEDLSSTPEVKMAN